MKLLTETIARYVFAVPFGVFGLSHFMDPSGMAGLVPIPGGVVWIYVTGVAMLAACISIIIQKYTRWACLLLALMLIIFVLTLHLPGVISDPENTRVMSNLLKDSSLAGGALILADRYD